MGKKKKLGKGSPQVLVQTVWWLLTQYFGIRGRQEHHNMKGEDFSFGLDENNIEYVEFIENPTKTRQSGLSAKPRSFLPKMFATGDERCPVAIFKEFLWRRPPETYNRSTSSLLRVKSVLASLVQATADGREQDQWHDEIRHRKNVTGGFIEKIFQSQR